MKTFFDVLLLCLLPVVIPAPAAAVAASADAAEGAGTAEPRAIASLLRQQLSTRSLDSGSVASWKQAFSLLVEKGEIMHARRVAWMLLYHPRRNGRTQGAMALISTYDLAEPPQVSALLALDNDCLRAPLLDLAEGGYFVDYPIGPGIAGLLDDGKYLQNHRQLRIVRILRALYHYDDVAIVGRVARFLDDPSRKIREVAARTLGKLTGHAFSRKGDMDLLPRNYYVAKARTWWFFNRQRPEYKVTSPRPVARATPELLLQEPADMLPAEIGKLQNEDFHVWSGAFDRLLGFGRKGGASVLRPLLTSAMQRETDRVYAATLLMLVDDDSRKRRSMSDSAFSNTYEKAFCL